ncbi:tRNA (guanine(9)-N(1))-methyltransferase [Curvularia kusanoi]|uniref:tRNA (guanine(9)-N1)-methyltransferase n=1 Tax=Curvularia kusanoi TaxID=90978 RepID=A0A9P4TIP4_CURKU|nr:tRNA (guanine(9)-N(1))-methyltransferase [Curvularia kusanoi]
MTDDERPNKLRKLGHLMEEEDPAASVGVTPAYTTPVDSPAPTTTENNENMDSDAGSIKLKNRHLDIEDAPASVGVTPSYTSPVDSPAATDDSEGYDARPAKIRKLAQMQEDAAASVGATPSYTTPVDPRSPVTTANSESAIVADEAAGAIVEEPKMSKNQLKKQRRHERWESGREDRKLKRKEKAKEKKERRREAWAAANTPDENGNIPQLPSTRPSRNTPGSGTQVPITVVFDCSWEDLMFDAELKSLGLQITRCYSDNRKAKYRTHLAVSNWGGKMKERFEGILGNQHTSWKGFRFFEEDFVEVSKQSREWMTGPRGGVVAGAMKGAVTSAGEAEGEAEAETEDKPSDEEGEIIYLSSESENTLTTLKPNSTYIIGGLVDKNRHKGVCHKRAVERGIKTAKLPIGEFLEMKSRQVLVTNHVLEIMLKWLELGDWGQAFMAVLPERKGAKLKDEKNEDGTPVDSNEPEETGNEEADEDMQDSTPETAADTAQAAADAAAAVQEAATQ